MKEHQKYSVMITDENGRKGSGTLFYVENSEYFYILTCAHVIFTSKAIIISILTSIDGKQKESHVIADRSQFHFSPLDVPTVIGNDSKHTCDIAIIECKKDSLPLESTRYAVYPMTEGERIMAVGYPPSDEQDLYYIQDDLSGEVLRVKNDANYFVIRIDEPYLNAADREAELKGYSGSPVWDSQKLENKMYLFGGLIAFGVGQNINGSRVNVMNARLLQNLLKDEFGLTIETKLPFIPESDVAPGFEKIKDTPDLQIVRASWIENERRKAKTYIDMLQLKKAIDICKLTINNAEFSKCDIDQKYSIYSIYLEAYRFARKFDIYDKIVEEMHSLGIKSDREDLTQAVRYYEAWNLDKAREYIERAIKKNPNGNEERVLSIVIKAEFNKDSDINILSDVLGSNDQLLIKPKDDEEEMAIYQILGYILGNRFKETGRAIRCLNRSYRISGNPIILESLGIMYYFHSIRNAFIEEGSDRIDSHKIEISEIEKARDALLRVFSAADEMWLRGTFKRAGLQIFKCFYFMHDNFRIYKHYHDVMRYFEFPDCETKRDIQICYLDVAIHKERVNLNEFNALTQHDRKFYELIQILEAPMQAFNQGLAYEAEITESELQNILVDAEKRLKELTETQIDNRLGFDGIHSKLINLYGNGILRFHWNALSLVKKHFSEIKIPLARETFSIYMKELQFEELDSIEKLYYDFFESHNDVLSFEELAHFYIRHGMFQKTKDLYDSVFEERRHLISEQSEYFYRSYIDFTLNHQFDLTPVIRCFVEHREDFKDVFIYLALEMDLNIATVTFNNPDKMIENAGILLDEGIYTQKDYNEKCLIINMLNCRPNFAEKYAAWSKGTNPINSTFAERILLVWKGAMVEQNPYWKSMKNKSIGELITLYNQERWTRNPMDILNECNTAFKKSIVVDLWSLYLFVKDGIQGVFDLFKTVYVTHNTVSMALQEINQVTDDDIKRVLIPLQIARNVVFLSPTLEQQLEVRSPDYDFMEVHSACLLAKVLQCPALIGEYRFHIPKKLQTMVIRPNYIDKVMECVLNIRMIEAD